jgi:hypothetical protein
MASYVEAYDTDYVKQAYPWITVEDDKLSYLKFIRDVVFANNRDLEVVQCRKYPEFGTVTRDDIKYVIATYIDKICDDNYKEDNVSISTDPDFLRREAARMLARAELFETVPTDDTFGEGQVLTYEKTFGGVTTYTFAAIKTPVGWYTTSTRGAVRLKGAPWREFVEALGEEGIRTLKVLDMDKATKIGDYVVGVLKELGK